MQGEEDAMRSRVIQSGTPSPPQGAEEHVTVVELTSRPPARRRWPSLPSLPSHRRKEFAMRSVVTRHPVVVFVVLAYAISWCLLPFGTFLPFGPLVAAVLVTALADGWGGLRRLGGRLLRWRVSWVWYAAAVALPLGAQAIALVGSAATGGPSPALLAWSPWYSYLLVAAVRLVNPVEPALGEEPAWRGFAQPRLQATRSPLRAVGILCLVVTGWHLPLYFIPQFGLRPFEMVSTAACTVVFGWLFNRSGGSVLIPLLSHVVEGTVRISDLMSIDADIVRAKLWYAGAWAGIAVALLLFDRRSWITAPASARDETPDGDLRPPAQHSSLAGLSTDRTRHEHARG
jgi:uncharacterized protein